MNKYFKLKWKKINPKNLIIFDRISLTIFSILLFLIWMMFLTKNFYPKSENNLAALIMNWPLQVSIWPVALIILFVFIMPIWVTSNFELLAIALFLSILFMLLNLILLIFLNINGFWVLWLVVDILVFFNIVFVLFTVYYLNKKNISV